MNTVHCNIPIFLPHAACPFRCVFCDQHIITAQKQIPTPEEAAQRIAEVLRTIPETAEVEVAFFGGSFTALPDTLQEGYLQAAQPFLQSGRVRHIRISTRPDCIDASVLTRLQRYGVRVIELGIQSFDAEVLHLTGRGYTPEQAEQACSAIRQAGFLLGVQLMPGLPGDTLEKSVQSARKAVELQADMARIYPTVVLKGTMLEKMMRQGRYHALSLEYAVEVSHEMLLVFQSAQIPVIRLGLYASEDLQKGSSVCGGAFHPALGELVEQRIFLEQAEWLLQKWLPLPAGETVIFYLNQRDISKFVGYKRGNWLRLREKYPSLRLRFVGLSVPETDWIGIGRSADAEKPEAVLLRLDYIRQRGSEILPEKA